MQTLTAGLLRRRGNPGTKGRLLAKSLEAYLLALETINRLTITYRVETFCALACNAWELLLKARILETTGDRASIDHPPKRGEPHRSLSLRDCLVRVYPDERDTTRRNVERVADLRDAAIHLFISSVPKDVLGLLQACVLNYHRALGEWFGVNLAERVPVGMMTIVFDVSPEQLDLANPLMRRRLGKNAADYLTSLSAELRAEHDELGNAPEFSVEIRYGLVIQKKPDGAAVLAITDEDGRPARVLRVPKDPAEDFPYRERELVDRLNARLDDANHVTTEDVRAVVAAHGAKRRNEWFYQGRVKGSPGQYSERFADWICGRFASDPSFFAKARDKRREMRRAALAVAS